MNASTTTTILRIARVCVGLGIFTAAWQIVQHFESAGAIIAMGMATGITIGGAYAASLMLEPSAGDTRQTSFPVPDEPEELHPVLAILRRSGGSVASNRELAAMLGVSPGQATKLHQEVSDMLIYEKCGRSVRISLA